LGPRRARHQLDRECGHARLRDLLHPARIGFAVVCWSSQRPQKSYQRLPAPHQPQIALAILVICPVTEHLHNNVRLRKYRGAIRQYFCALVFV
jgi:hypothetical protein